MWPQGCPAEVFAETPIHACDDNHHRYYAAAHQSATKDFEHLAIRRDAVIMTIWLRQLLISRITKK